MAEDTSQSATKQNLPEDSRARLAQPWGIVTPAENDPAPEFLTQGTVPDVLDPIVPGVTTQDRGAEMSDDLVSTDPTANRPVK